MKAEALVAAFLISINFGMQAKAISEELRYAVKELQEIARVVDQRNEAAIALLQKA